MWATSETWERKVSKVVMVSPIISYDRAVPKDTVRRWKDFAHDIRVDWVQMAHSIVRHNVVIVGKFFNKGSWVSEAWRKAHWEEFEEEHQGAPERIPTFEERRELHLDTELVGVVCVRPSGTPPPSSARLTSAGRGNPNRQGERTNQPC